jgi:hypothetical protein
MNYEGASRCPEVAKDPTGFLRATRCGWASRDPEASPPGVEKRLFQSHLKGEAAAPCRPFIGTVAISTVTSVRWVAGEIRRPTQPFQRLSELLASRVPHKKLKPQRKQPGEPPKTDEIRNPGIPKSGF